MHFLRVLLLFLFSALFFSCSNSSPHVSTFAYDLEVYASEQAKEKVILCLHGFGGNYRVGHAVAPFFKGKATVISFNLPDHDKHSGEFDPHDTVFGTINELLPVLYMLKQTIIDEGIGQLALYGFSAGGAAAINCISVLNTSIYDQELKMLGIRQKEKKKILEVLQRGDIILDTPLKSIEEIVAVHGKTQELEVIGERYLRNGMNPIESLKNWENLSLNVWVHFQMPDEVLSNRDDGLFVETIKKYNRGQTQVLIGYESGHQLPHPELWDSYLQKTTLF